MIRRRDNSIPLGKGTLVAVLLFALLGLSGMWWSGAFELVRGQR